MLDVTEQIQTLSELSIAMAGFAGVVFVLDRSTHSVVAVFRVTNLLVLSFLTMAICLVHSVIANTYEPALSNRLSSGVLAVLVGGILATFSLPNYFRLAIPNRSQTAKLIAILGPPMTVCSPVLALINAFGVFSQYSGSVLLLCLVLMLFSCALQFIAAIVDRDPTDDA